jgi:hypothetical protein
MGTTYVLEPELAGALQDVFEAAWREINLAYYPPLSDGNAQARRSDLARMIILAHQSGLQPDEIKRAILGDIARSRGKGDGKIDGPALQNRGDGKSR